jgi:hypothetical protein
VRSTTEEPGRCPPACLLVAAGILLCATSLALFSGLQYRMPSSFESRWGHNYAGARHFQETLAGGAVGPMEHSAFRGWFRGLLASAWAGYALALLGMLMGGDRPARRGLAVVVVLALAMAIGCPPSLSYDCYAYVAFARMPLCYGLNPCVTTPRDLVALGDPTAPIVGSCQMPSVYGPAWTLLTMAHVALLARYDLIWQIIGLKLLAAGALVVGAVAAREVSEHYHPGRGRLALLAVGLNPLLLVEGPANGHNDLLMMALFLGAVALWLRGRETAGDLLFGLSVGLKFLPIVALPWVLLERRRSRERPPGVRSIAATCLLALAPTAVSYVPFWRGAETFTAQSRRTQWGVPGAGGADREGVGRLCEAIGLPEAARLQVQFLVGQWPVIDLYLGLTLWLWWGRGPGRWLDAWSVLAFGLVFWTMAVRFPWYLAWPLMLCLTRWGRCQVCISLAWMLLSFRMMLDYAA